jgi:HlyD family secretion protein
LNRKWLIAIGFVAVVGLLVWANLRKAGPGPEDAATAAAGAQVPKNAPAVKVVKMAPRDLTQRVMAPGTLEASAPQEIRAPFSSPRAQVYVGAGDKVTAGQIIGGLDAVDLSVQVASLEAAVARAESALAQLQTQQQGAPLTAAGRVESANAQLVAAEASLENALKQAEAAQQRLEQAQAALRAVQNRAAVGTVDAAAARALSAELAAAYENVAKAERDLAESGEGSAAVRQARAQVASAQASLQSAKADAAAGGVTAGQLRSAQADLAAQRASLDAARAKLEQAVVRARTNGTVLSVGLKDGQPVQQGQVIFEIGGLDTLTVKARVDEVDVGKVQVGQALTMTNNAYVERFQGRVTRVAARSGAAGAPQGAAGGTFYEVEGEVTNRGGQLRAGMSAEARIITESRKNVLVVGLEAVREEGEKASVLVVAANKVEVRAVQLGLRTQTEVEITAGLQEGEQVIVGPFTLIKSLKGGAVVKAEVVEAQDRGDEE